MKLRHCKSEDQFIQVMRDTMRQGGTVFLPTQELVDVVNECAACEGLPGKAVMEDYSCDCWREFEQTRDFS